ncbi:IS5 family transposase [Xanthomonas oryzae pv. oryzae]|uniref:IS5 family transposase n=1 Tax=Xanthomonas oryzae TaxID=347 RepID=UPI000DE10B59|nr:IS5 family transposase [Xanthomonas oryzae]RBJ27220.1 IS5 family transposase [Xanthomonas oryzae pv. oryzae]
MQLTFGDAGDLGKRKQTRREIFMADMEQVVPWQQLRVLIAPHSPVSGRPGRQPYALATMWRIHLLQQWYALSDPAMEEALHEIATLRRFTQLGGLDDIPDEPTILNVRRLLETHGLAARMLEAVNAHLARKGQSFRSGTIVDARLIAAPSSTKNAHHARDTEMHQTRKRNQWYFGMKAHIGVDAFSVRAHHVHGTAANVADVTVTHTLLHGKEDRVFGNSGYTGAEKRDELRDCKAACFFAARPSTIQAIGNNRERAREQRWEHVKASVRAKVEHPFRVIKRRFGYTKVRYRGLAENTAHVLSLFALSTLWMKRKQLLHAMESVRL